MRRAWDYLHRNLPMEPGAVPKESTFAETQSIPTAQIEKSTISKSLNGVVLVPQPSDDLRDPLVCQPSSLI